MKNKDKGFSLIELIIVIAIMAVLVAIVAPNLTKYLGKSKRGTDLHNADDLANTILTSIMDYEVNYGNFIPAGGPSVSLTWVGRTLTGGPAPFNAMVDGMVTKDPTSQETGAYATASVSLKTTDPKDGYNILVIIGNTSVAR